MPAPIHLSVPSAAVDSYKEKIALTVQKVGTIQMRYFEDFQVGESIELGTRATITQEEIIAFARDFDPQPFHVDPERARDSIFGGLVASGWHTAALFMRLFVDGLLNQTASLGSPGVDELRWLKPVRPGDTLQAHFTVVESTPSRSRPDRGIIRGKCEVLNQEGQVVMSVISVGFFGRRPHAMRIRNGYD